MAALRFRDRLFGQPQGVEIVIESLVLHQRRMVALLHDSASIEHEDSIGALNRAEPVRDDKRGLSCH